MWIKNRIDTEYKKHGTLDWSKIAESKISSQITLEFRYAYNKCKNGLEKIRNQKPRENNTPRDWEQRIEEILLLYSAIMGISFNKAKKWLSSKHSKEKVGK